MIIKEIKGDLLDTYIKHIAHGVNCQNTMGSGVAKTLYTKYPQVKTEYHKYHLFMANQELIHCLLGSIDIVDCGDKKIVNCFTQEYYGRDGRRYVDYTAIRDCFNFIINAGIKEIAIPKIGCGLAGGDWDIIKQVINDITKDKIDVYVYYL